MIFKFLIKKNFFNLCLAWKWKGISLQRSQSCLLSRKDHKNGLRIWGGFGVEDRGIVHRRTWNHNASKSLKGQWDNSPL